MNHKDCSGENNHFWGKNHSEETIKIIKEKRKNQVIKSRKIGLYNIEGCLLKEFNNINEVMEFYNFEYKKRYYYNIVETKKVINDNYLSYL